MQRFSTCIFLLGCLPACATGARQTGPAVQSQFAEESKRSPGVAAFSNQNAIFVGKGTREYVFISDRGGGSQLYLGDLTQPAASARRLTDFPRGVSTMYGRRIVREPGQRSVLLMAADPEGRPQAAILRVALDGSQPVERVPAGDTLLWGPYLAQSVERRLWFWDRPAGKAGLRLHAQPAEGGTAELVWQESGFAMLLDLTPDGGQALFATAEGLKLVDFASRTHMNLAAFSNAWASRFSSDGKRVFAAGIDADDRGVLAAFDVGSGKETARFLEETLPHVRVQSIVVAATNDRLAVTTQVGTHNRIQVHDATTLQPAFGGAVDLPMGTGSASDFTPDGVALAITWSTPRVPVSQLLMHNLATGDVRPLRRERPTAAQVPVSTSVVSIDAADGLAIHTNVYRPEKTSVDKLPVVVSLHGGPHGVSMLAMNENTRFFLGEGFAVVEPNIRGSIGFGAAFEAADRGRGRVDSFNDLKQVGTWLRQQSWVDADRLVLFGASYGGYLALVGLTRQPELWRAAIDLYGITDWRSFLASTNQTTADVFIKEVGSPKADGAFLDSISPLQQAGKIQSPLFVYHGVHDSQVPLAQSTQLIDRLRQAGKTFDYMASQEEHHGMRHKATRERFRARVTSFLRSHVLDSSERIP